MHAGTLAITERDKRSQKNQLFTYHSSTHEFRHDDDAVATRGKTFSHRLAWLQGMRKRKGCDGDER